MRCSGYKLLIIAALVCGVCRQAEGFTRYMDDSSDCSQTETVTSYGEVTVKATGTGGSAFLPSSCRMTFKAFLSTSKLKVTFDDFNMPNCDTDLFIYESFTTTSLREKLSCGSSKPTSFVTSGRYVTLFLSRGTSVGHRFTIKISAQDDDTDYDYSDLPGKVFNLAIGVFVAIVVGVVAVIVICIVVCICCCCRNNRRSTVRQPAAAAATTTTTVTGSTAYHTVPTSGPPGSYPPGGYTPQGYPPGSTPYPPPGGTPYPPPGGTPYPPPGGTPYPPPESTQGYPAPQAYPSAPPAYGEVEYTTNNDQVKMAPPP
ncbi:uncharacterized protein LOC106169709 isoform X2 [Lingula anatina]|uniref:Uncharacterized protein LOC106169709 isoform X2 n=1 Tax=Lingula anatina TaxID=7574 RepID=A0A1S3J3B4_LINAN|nr:uncharacterized protein LOC106169709 isoform X2 [Lingula anatina]|eukprot:XP_013404748.1 uncharacterized protein LOC106169709 isoform X2 [Lingula anatina]